MAFQWSDYCKSHWQPVQLSFVLYRILLGGSAASPDDFPRYVQVLASPVLLLCPPNFCSSHEHFSVFCLELWRRSVAAVGSHLDLRRRSIGTDRHVPPERMKALQSLSRHFGRRGADLGTWEWETENGLPDDVCKSDFVNLKSLARRPLPPLDAFSGTEKVLKLEKIALTLLKENEQIPLWMSYSTLSRESRSLRSAFPLLLKWFPAGSRLEYWTAIPDMSDTERIGLLNRCTAAWTTLHAYLTDFEAIPKTQVLNDVLSGTKSNVERGRPEEEHPELRLRDVLGAERTSVLLQSATDRELARLVQIAVDEALLEGSSSECPRPRPIRSLSDAPLPTSHRTIPRFRDPNNDLETDASDPSAHDFSQPHTHTNSASDGDDDYSEDEQALGHNRRHTTEQGRGSEERIRATPTSDSDAPPEGAGRGEVAIPVRKHRARARDASLSPGQSLQKPPRRSTAQIAGQGSSPSLRRRMPPLFQPPGSR